MEDLQDLADSTYLELQEARGEMEDEEEELNKPDLMDTSQIPQLSQIQTDIYVIDIYSRPNTAIVKKITK